MGRKAFLDPAESAAIEAQVAGLEAKTGVQLVSAIIGKSDSYVELPWKAFALGTALASLALVVVDAWRPQWSGGEEALTLAVTILGVGAASALLAIAVPPYARLYLRATRRDLEVRHYAQALFLRRELFRTPRRNGILMLVSLFERKIDILPDVGLHARIDAADWRGVIEAMTPLLRERRCFDALQVGIGRTQAMLLAKGMAVAAGGNELPDRPVQETGPR
ncbi:MAG TPA: TPM domain-containing protein [Casimicrobiaceae bacterium]|jgi:putative membrane protein